VSDFRHDPHVTSARTPEGNDGRVRDIAVLTHRRPAETTVALKMLVAEAARAGVTLRFDEEEARKHKLAAGPGLEIDREPRPDPELCVVLGGDGTILRALRRYAASAVPVFAVNYGEIGFLATVEPEDVEDGIHRALTGDFELRTLPAISLDIARRVDGESSLPAGGGLPANPGSPAERSVQTGRSVETAINDVAIHRKVGERVAQLAYALDGEELGSVRCDGLVVATPAGSTGYNLANGGPVMAWGVEGFVVSFIAPHSLTARALVAAPGDRLTIHNRSREALDVSVDGRPVGEIAADATIHARFVANAGTIAQLPDSSFYRRLREKFGRLAR
jgi:NAD+ kinase